MIFHRLALTALLLLPSIGALAQVASPPPRMPPPAQQLQEPPACELYPGQAQTEADLLRCQLSIAKSTEGALASNYDRATSRLTLLQQSFTNLEGGYQAATSRATAAETKVTTMEKALKDRAQYWASYVAGLKPSSATCQCLNQGGNRSELPHTITGQPPVPQSWYTPEPRMSPRKR